MNTTKALLAGLGGAIALNILHESFKKRNDMPRIDLLGEEALQSILQRFGRPITNENSLYLATLGGDLLSNALFYSLIASGERKNVWGKAVTLGLSAGAGAVLLPEKIGLDSDTTSRTEKTRLITIGYYLFGALVTAAIVEATSDK